MNEWTNKQTMFCVQVILDPVPLGAKNIVTTVSLMLLVSKTFFQIYLAFSPCVTQFWAWICHLLTNHCSIRIRIRMSFIARYVYTYKEFVFVTEATAVQQNDSDKIKTQIIQIWIKKDKQIRNNNINIDNFMYRYITMDNLVCTGIVCAIEVLTKYVC